MPLYEYRCDACQAAFEELVLSAASLHEVTCPRCRGSSVHRELSVFAPRAGHSEPACAQGCETACAQGGCELPGPAAGGCCGGSCHH